MSSLILAYCIEELPLDLDIPDWVLLLLFSGVGIYAPTDRTVDNRIYNSIVLELASKKSLAFVISNDSICYGANYPFSHVLIGTDLIKSHSKYTYWQLAGRTGRVNSSWTSTVIVFDDAKDIIYNYIQRKDPVTIEALNMIRALERLNLEAASKKKVYNQEETSKIFFYKPNSSNEGGTDIEIKGYLGNSELDPCIMDDDLDTVWGINIGGNTTSTNIKKKTWSSAVIEETDLKKNKEETISKKNNDGESWRRQVENTSRSTGEYVPSVTPKKPIIWGRSNNFSNTYNRNSGGGSDSGTWKRSNH